MLRYVTGSCYAYAPPFHLLVALYWWRPCSPNVGAFTLAPDGSGQCQATRTVPGSVMPCTGICQGE